MMTRLRDLHTNLVGRMLLYVVVPTFVIFAGINTMATVTNLAAMRRASEARLRKQAALVALRINGETREAVISAQRMAEAQVAGMFGDREASIEFAHRVLESTPLITGAYFGYEPNADRQDQESLGVLPEKAMGESGRFLPYWYVTADENRALELEPLVDMETSLYYQGAKDAFLESKKAEPFITEPYVYQGKMIYEQVYPIVINDQFVGVAGVDRALADVELPLRQVAKEEQVDLFLVSSRNKFIAATTDPEHGSVSESGDLLKTREVSATEYSDLFASLLDADRESDVVRDDDPRDGDACYYAVASIPTGDWSVVLRASEATITGSIWRPLIFRVLLGMTGLLVVITLMLILTVRLRKRIQRAVVAAERVAEGDLTGEIEATDCRDETGVLIQAVNKMTQGLNALVGAVKLASLQLNSTATQIAAAASEQTATTQGFNASTSEIAASITQISATGQELLRTVEDVHGRANETASRANSGRALLTNMESNMGQLAEATGSISSKLGMIREKAGAINVVVETITKVADQTNLLSINAAIEAEKAGEAGRGFLVVAREVRRLADQTAVATLDIEQIVGQMRDAVSAGVMEMDNFSNQVGVCITQVAEISGHMGEIISQVETLSERFQHVSDGMRQQSQGARQIDEAMAHLVTGVHKVSETVKDFNSAAGNLRRSAGSLKQEVEQFKVEE